VIETSSEQIDFRADCPLNLVMELTVATYKDEVKEAVRNYDRYIVCLDKTPDECEAALNSLLEKAIKAYANRGPNLRHGIALDKQVTIILSQSESERPLCGIYFNLHSPYRKKQTAKAAEAK
jgi:hypothetical protein